MSLAATQRAQTFKKDLAGKVARDGGGWAEHATKLSIDFTPSCSELLIDSI